MNNGIKGTICSLSATWDDEQVAQFADRLEQLIENDAAISGQKHPEPHSALSEPDDPAGVQ